MAIAREQQQQAEQQDAALRLDGEGGVETRMTRAESRE